MIKRRHEVMLISVCFITLIFMIVGSYVMSSKKTDLLYVIFCMYFLIRYLRIKLRG